MAAIDLITTSDAKAWIVGQGNQIGNSDDGIIGRLVTAASQLILSYTNRKALLTASYQDVWQAHGENTRVLTAGFPSYANSDATAVTAVKVGAVTIPQSTDRVMAGWVLVGNILTLIGYEFCRGTFCEVDYTAGFADANALPYDLKQAAIELVALKYRRRKNINLVSENIAGMSTTFSQADLTPEIKATLDRYKQVVTQ